MDGIIKLTGKVRFPITIDPGVWIFDERRVDLDTFFEQARDTGGELEAYTKSVSKQWDKEFTEGAQLPEEPGKKKFEKQKVLEGTFGMPIGPFLKNAEPEGDATTFSVIADGKEYTFPLSEAYSLVAAFSNKGKPLREDGPIHLYLEDGSNRDNPIRNVTEFIIK
ncbi:peptidyl-prolyl cis-trans isomerase [Neobacillus piezotolerans]|uniref:Peptidyl-prolyl cis-trans isomerase n=1 Tax=Neobacillus piezotolerans TaxID=2259171 RepID=A0A3D8GVE2_9BACI|nr:peptidyl-prolyl cis-trans isomerase [Neobacillus piezotolerans]RDU38440.1 peptidyl-prolyl cis-trans isomerase [Neobacillus piezotolerans]